MTLRGWTWEAAIGPAGLGDRPLLAALEAAIPDESVEASIDGMQDAVARRYEPLVWWLDHLGSDLDEIATDYGLRVSRGLAWYNAIRLQDERSREDALAAIKLGPLVLIEQVRRPPIWSLRFVLRGMRWVSSFFRRWPSADRPLS